MKKLLIKSICVVFVTLLSSNTFADTMTIEDLALREMDKQDHYLAMTEQRSFNQRLKGASTEEAIDDAFDLMEEANQD